MPFLITILAGLSTLIGFLFIYIKKNDNFVLITSLAFSGGVMFFISVFDLIPESFVLINKTYYSIFSIMLCIIFILIGIIISSIIDKYFPSENYDNSKLYHVGIISMVAIIIHNIPEGIATYLTSTRNLKLGITLALAIALHNIPEGISISIPIYYSTGSKIKSFLYTLISGLSELFGALLAFLFLRNFNNDLFMGSLYSLIAGIMLYISTISLFLSSIRYKKYFLSTISFIIGMFLIYISILLLK